MHSAMKLSTQIALNVAFISYNSLTFGDLCSHFCIKIDYFHLYLPGALFYMVKTQFQIKGLNLRNNLIFIQSQ